MRCTGRHYVANNGTSLRTMADPASAVSTITPARLESARLMQSLVCELRFPKRSTRWKDVLDMEFKKLDIFPEVKHLVYICKMNRAVALS